MKFSAKFLFFGQVMDSGGNNTWQLEGPRPDIQAVMAEASAEMIKNALLNSPSLTNNANVPPSPAKLSDLSLPPPTNPSSPSSPPPPSLDLLRNLGYYFDADGYLRDALHKRPDETALNASSCDLVAAIAHYVHSVLIKTYSFERVLIPSLEEAVVPEARAPIFCSDDYLDKEKLLVIVQGSGRGLKPGIWSRTLCMTEGLNMGSMLPQIQMALHHDYGVVILNPNERSYLDKTLTPSVKHPIRYSERPETHALYVWEHFIVPAKSQDIYILGYGYGGEVVRHVLAHLADVEGRAAEQSSNDTDNANTLSGSNDLMNSLSRVAAVALMESSHRIEANRDHSKLVQYCKRNMINWKSSYQAFGYLIEHRGQEHSRQYMQGCLCISSGDCGSNVATSIRKVLKPIFEFFAIADRDRKKQRRRQLRLQKRTEEADNETKQVSGSSAASTIATAPTALTTSVTKRFWKIQSQKLKLRKEAAEQLKTSTNNDNKNHNKSNSNSNSSNNSSNNTTTNNNNKTTEHNSSATVETKSNLFTETSATRRGSDGALVALWNPDTSHCELCNATFTFWNRRHHCRICGRVVCDPCSQNRLFVPGYRGAARVCSSCFEVEMGQTTRVSLLGKELNKTKDSMQRKKSSSKLGVDDFQLIKVLGKGAFGKVYMVKRKTDGEIYAMKVLHKDKVKKQQQIEHTQTERWVLAETSHPFITSLRFAFQSIKKLYLVMDYMVGGELFFHLQKEGRFSEDKCRFYAAELVSALSYLHSEEGGHVVYRDLKPENLLLDREGHIQVTDFGLAKRNVTTPNGATTFVGSPEYVAPEVLGPGRYGYGYGKAVDWWSLGTLIYEMLNGLPPFYDRNKQVMFERIQFAQLLFPEHFSASSQTMLRGLLTRDPAQRLGSGHDGSNDIRSCPFFTKIDWLRLEARDLQPPWVPSARGEKTDTNNFDTRGVSMTDSLKSQKSALGNSNSNGGNGNGYGNKSSPMFSGFTFIPEERSLLQKTINSGQEMSDEMQHNNTNGLTTEDDVLFALRIAMDALEVEQDPEERDALEQEISQYKAALEVDGGEDAGLFDNFDGEYLNK